MRFNVLSSRILSPKIIQAKNTSHHAPDCHRKTSFSEKYLQLNGKIFQFLSLASPRCRNGGKKVQHLPLIISVRDEDEKPPDWCISSWSEDAQWYLAVVCQWIFLMFYTPSVRRRGRRDVVFVDVDNVALIFMLVMSFLGTTNMNIKQIANISTANIQH